MEKIITCKNSMFKCETFWQYFKHS